MDRPPDYVPIQCKAKNRAGSRCKKYASPGHKVCTNHGAKAPLAIAKVAREIAMAHAEVGARKILDRMGITPVEDPLTELKHLAGEVVLWKDVLRQMVEDLKEKYRYEGEHAEQIRGEVLLYERAQDRAGMVLGLIAKLRIDERLAAIEEAKVEAVVKAVELGLASLDLPVETTLAAQAAVARQLRAVG